MKRPKPIEFEELVCRPIRAPSTTQPHWYWRATARGGERPTVWTGRGARAAVRATLLQLLAEGLPERKDLEPEDDSCEDLGDLLAYFIGDREGRKDLRDHSKRAMRNSARRLKRTIGSVAIDRVTTATLEEHRDRALGEGYSTGTVREDWTTLQAAVKWGKTRNLVTGDPVLRKPQMTHRPVREVYVPEHDEVAKLLGALGGWHRIAVLLLAETAARRDEVVTLVWSAVDLKGGWLTIRAAKTGKTRRVPLGREALAEMREWRLKTPGARVLPVTNQTARGALFRKLKTVCERENLPMISPQSLRRYREREFSRSRVGVEVFAELLGHSPAVALKHYLRPTDGDLRDALDRVERARTVKRAQDG